MQGLHYLALVATLTMAGCHRPSAAPTSLVGATKLPSSADLQKEIIIIARMGGKDGKDLLNIEIRPTNEVVAAHYREPDKTNPVAQEKLSVATDEVERLRRMMWRLRPDDNAPAEKTIPLGCHWVYDAGFEWAVAYVRSDRPATLLQFTLPYSEYCKTPAYAQAGQLIGAAMKALPPSSVVRDFPPGRYNALGTYTP